MSTDGDLAGRLDAYLTEKLGRSVRASALRQYPSGFSWLTYGFSIAAPGFDGVTDLILRLGPTNGLYAPYTAAPQFEVMAILDRSAVPAPRAFAWSDDEAVLGAPFFIAEKSPGETRIPWDDDAELTGGDRQSLGAQFADALGELHALEWRHSNLARFADGLTLENAAARQVDLWESSFRRWALRPHPMMHRALAWLRAHLPRAERLGIIHGDYRLGNFLECDGRITAILDWELVHLGDPHEDLAWTCLPVYRGGTTYMSKLVSREELYARHEAKTGRPVLPASMEFYTVFSMLKLAATHMAGAYVFERNGFSDMRMPAMGTQIAPTLRQIEKTLEDVT